VERWKTDLPVAAILAAPRARGRVPRWLARPPAIYDRTAFERSLYTPHRPDRQHLSAGELGSGDSCRTARIVHTSPDGGSPLGHLAVNPIVFGDPEPYILSNSHPEVALVGWSPRIPSEAIVVGGVTWAVRGELGQSAFPAVAEAFLVVPGAEPACDDRIEAVVARDVVRPLSVRSDFFMESS